MLETGVSVVNTSLAHSVKPTEKLYPPLVDTIVYTRATRRGLIPNELISFICMHVSLGENRVIITQAEKQRPISTL